MLHYLDFGGMTWILELSFEGLLLNETLTYQDFRYTGCLFTKIYGAYA